MMSRSIDENLKKDTLFFSNYFPLQIWALKFCKKVLFFFSNYMYLHLQIWTSKICNQDISKTITARSFKLCQLIDDDEYINW